MFILPVMRKNVRRAFVLFITIFASLTITVMHANAKSSRSNSNSVKSVSNFKQPTKTVRHVVRKKRMVVKTKSRNAKYIKRVSKSHRSKTRALRPPVRRNARTIGKSRGLSPRLRHLLVKIRLHYGRSVIITSGCRSHRHNRRVGGAKHSMHLRCMAADIKVSGVSKGRLRRYVSGMSGRGGVGTYCGRSIVHLDVGPRRSWYYGCGKRHRKSRRRG